MLFVYLYYYPTIQKVLVPLIKGTNVMQWENFYTCNADLVLNY